MMDDSPLDIPVTGGVYRPKNYDNRFHGMGAGAEWRRFLS